MNNKLILIGHISRDIMIDYLGNETKVVGGAVIYAASAIAKSGIDLTVISKLPEKENELKKHLLNDKANWIIKPSHDMTSIRNEYFTQDKEKRKVTLLSKADSFHYDEIKEYDGSLYYLAGLFVGEIPDSLIIPLSQRGDVALDAQGVLRVSDSNGNMELKDWNNKLELLPCIKYLKVDAAEAEVLTGYKDREKAIYQLGKWGVKEVMLTHNKEIMVLANNKLYKAPYTNKNNSGRTGRGDTTFSSYLAWRQNHDIETSTNFSAALCSIKMETPGVFKGNIEDVLKRIS